MQTVTKYEHYDPISKIDSGQKFMLHSATVKIIAIFLSILLGRIADYGVSISLQNIVVNGQELALITTEYPENRRIARVDFEDGADEETEYEYDLI